MIRPRSSEGWKLKSKPLSVFSVDIRLSPHFHWNVGTRNGDAYLSTSLPA